MGLKEAARIPLPGHSEEGEFDHAAVDRVSDRLFVAHPSNDAVEVVDLRTRRHLRSIRGVPGVAGVWVDARRRRLFTSNRGADTACAYRIQEDGEEELLRVRTGARPNGMAFDPDRQLWMIAGVGDTARSGAPPTLTFVDLREGKTVSQLTLPARTRWATYHKPTDAFYVALADPPAILSIPASDPVKVGRSFSIPARGPHGLEQGLDGRTLYSACDEGTLVALDLMTGQVTRLGSLPGPPDVLWLDPGTKHLFVAIGEPGRVLVFGIDPPRLVETVPTAPGAHTLTVDPLRHEVHVFLPESHEDLVLIDPDRSDPV